MYNSWFFKASCYNDEAAQMWNVMSVIAWIYFTLIMHHPSHASLHHCKWVSACVRNIHMLHGCTLHIRPCILLTNECYKGNDFLFFVLYIFNIRWYIQQSLKMVRKSIICKIGQGHRFEQKEPQLTKIAAVTMHVKWCLKYSC